jgi:predicted enzyme related to lactoylglutathione lyase
MHRSRLAGIIIDCRTEDLDKAAEFWSAALGYPCADPPEAEASVYRSLRVPEGETYVEVQKVEHDSRVHLDIEADDIDAEADRLHALGAKKIARIKQWWVMEAPTGQRFCIVPPAHSEFGTTANVWDDPQG